MAGNTGRNVVRPGEEAGEGGITVIGFWDADTNDPDLSSLTQNDGEAYQVSVAGTTNLNGEARWRVRDLAVWNDDLAGNWYKLDNTDDVLSVNTRFDANDATFPSSNPAAATSRNAHPALRFEAGVDQSAILHSVMPLDYSGGDINASIDWVAATATSGAVLWGVEVEAMPDGFNIDSDSFDTRQTETTAAPGTSGDITTTTITLTNAEADDITAGSAFRLKLTRVGTDGSDTMTGDALALRIVVDQ